MNGISKELVLNLFRYVDGTLIRRCNVSANARKGDIVGCDDHKGYLMVGINYKKYFVHRIIFLMFNGYLPKVVDHEDGKILNNKEGNLRDATTLQNNRNNRNRKMGEIPVKGVTKLHYGSYRVQISINNKSKHIGVFRDLELAELVAIEARNKYFGEFASHEGVVC